MGHDTIDRYMYGIIMHAKCTRKSIVIQNIKDIIIVWISFTKITVTIFDKLKPNSALTQHSSSLSTNYTLSMKGLTQGITSIII